MDKYSKWQQGILIGGVIFLIYYLFFHTSNQPTISLKKPTVIVQNPTLKMRGEYLMQTGNTVAFQSVDLVARVEGYLQAINFTDGTFVKKKTSLFVIEPQPYLEQLKEAQATLASKQAGLVYAKSEYARQQRMYRQNATSLNSVEKWRANRDQAASNLAQAKARVTTAKINYSYTHVVAPFDGRVGRHLVDKGNLVGNGQATTLATIEQVNPLYVYFNLNELDLLRVRKAAKAQGISAKDITKIPVEVALQDESGFPHKGHLDFVNTGLNASMGTIEFRALLENQDYSLLPGLFVKIRVALSPPVSRLTVPDKAVKYDQAGPYLLLVNKKDMVVMQRVKLGDSQQGFRTVKTGLKPTDRVIVEGLQYASPGIDVTVKPLSSGVKS